MAKTESPNATELVVSPNLNLPPVSVAGVELRFGLTTNVVAFGDSVLATGWDGIMRFWICVIGCEIAEVWMSRSRDNWWLRGSFEFIISITRRFTTAGLSQD